MNVSVTLQRALRMLPMLLLAADTALAADVAAPAAAYTLNACPVRVQPWICTPASRIAISSVLCVMK